jgi:hypothetical protein
MMWEWVIGLTVAVWLTLDLYCYLTPGTKSLSFKVVEWSKRWPLLPFILGLFVGIVAGHFWPVAVQQ